MQALSADGEVLSTAADLVDCRRLLRTGSRSFHAASRLLPRQLRDAACGLYAFCREADDAIDEGGDPQRALVHLRQRLDAIYRPPAAGSAVDRAFAAVVARHGLPRELPDALLEGFAWDAEARSYEDLDGVLAYAARVAGSVGVMMALLMGRREPAVLARAADLGVAMQLTNIARDVGEDARAGRLYLPRDWLREAGIDPLGFLAEPVHSEALAGVVRRLLTVADTLYRRADSGLAQLPPGARPAMYAARLLYAAIGAEVARRGHDAVTSRSVVPGPVKLRLLLKVPRLLASRGQVREAPALIQTRFLLDAVRRHPLPPVPSTSSAGPLAQAVRKINWVLELFAELERRDREQPIRLHVQRTRVSLRQPQGDWPPVSAGEAS